MLEQAMVSYGNAITDENVRDLLELGGEEEALELVGHVINGKPAEAMGVIGRFTGGGSDLRQLHRAATSFFRGVLLAKTGNLNNAGFAQGTVERLQELASATTMSDLLRALRAFAAADLARDASSPLPIELAIVESTLPPEPAPAPPASVQPAQRGPAASPACKEAARPGPSAPGPRSAPQSPNAAGWTACGQGGPGHGRIPSRAIRDT